jgi:biotin transport system substrate-specific component
MRIPHTRAEATVLTRSRLAAEVLAVTAFAALTALSARVQFHLPFTPVPVTGQVFAVLLAGVMLGPRLGFVSQVQYLAAGAAGLPVFAYGGGLPAVLGPTGGYLVGFPFAALAVGALSARHPGFCRTLLACLSGAAVIHLFGASWLAVWHASTGQATLAAVLAQSLFPFLAIDIAKAALVAVMAPSLRRYLPSA